MAQYDSDSRTSSLRDHTNAVPYRLLFVYNLRTSFLCCAQACGYECFIVHSKGCGGGSMSGNEVSPAEV